MVETHQRRVVFPGRQQAIVGVQLGLNLGAQRLGLCLIHANDADPPEGAHRFAIQHGGRRAGVAGVVAESQPESSTQAPSSAARKKVISINRGSSYQGDKSIPARLNQT
jgi:hypothetical protein